MDFLSCLCVLVRCYFICGTGFSSIVVFFAIPSNTFSSNGGKCTEIDIMPNATISEYGTYTILTDRADIVHKLQAEIYARGPVATGVNAEPLVKYTGGLVNDTKLWHMMVNHIVSIVGWQTDPESGNVYWIVRNSWGSYYGEMGYFREFRRGVGSYMLDQCSELVCIDHSSHFSMNLLSFFHNRNSRWSQLVGH